MHGHRRARGQAPVAEGVAARVLGLPQEERRQGGHLYALAARERAEPRIGLVDRIPPVRRLSPSSPGKTRVAPALTVAPTDRTPVGMDSSALTSPKRWKPYTRRASECVIDQDTNSCRGRSASGAYGRRVRNSWGENTFMNRKLSYFNDNRALMLGGPTGGPRGRTRVVYCLAAIAVLVSCGPTYYIPLKPEHASAITSTRVHATIVQEEVNAEVKVANTRITNAGLLGAIVGAVVDTAITSHRAGEAEKLVEPIRREVSDFDFRAAFFDSLNTTLPALRTLRMANLTTSKASPTPELLATVLARTREGTFLSLITRYELSADFRTFSVYTTAEILQHGREEPLYRGTFVYVTEPIPGGKEPEAAARAWASDHGATFRTAMREGIDETMKMLVLDLGAAPVGEQARSASAKAPGAPAARASASPTAEAPASPTAGALSTAGAPASTTPAPASLADGALASIAAAPASPTGAPPSPTAKAPASIAPASTSLADGVPASTAAAPASQPTGAPPSPAAKAPAAPASTTPSSTAAAPASPPAGVPAPASTAAPPALSPAKAAASVPPRAAAFPPARAGRGREIVRRANGIMYSAPREEHTSSTSDL